MKKQKFKLQFLIMALMLPLFTNINAQYNASSDDSYDSYVSRKGWSWTIDDAQNLPEGEGFRWWNHGGNCFADLFMQLRVVRGNCISLEIPTETGHALFSLSANDHRSSTTDESILPFLFLTKRDERSCIFYGKNHFLNLTINPRSPLNPSTISNADGFRFIDSKGADITNEPESYGRELMRIQKNGKVGIGTPEPATALHLRGDFRVQNYINDRNYSNTEDNFNVHVARDATFLTSSGDERGMFVESKTGNKITIGDGNDDVMIKSSNIICDNGTLTDDIYMSVNTMSHVKDAALTVAGTTYIGPKADLAAAGKLSKFNESYLSKYCLWVEKGIVSEDFAFAGVAVWRDDVFNSDYDLMPLEEVKKFINQNNHLPDIPSAESVKENGYTAHQMNMILLQKIEELTLYTISLSEEIKEMKKGCVNYKQ
ncbi:hypothetical protein [Flavobacterium sp. WV_118_3]|uniref:hypothetical protein n=1 Tax=Flavobacterium sp. WV_118_3 TaxID=3151764 RepID=UPI002B994C96|nr:hypothetical protein [Flavobacterium sp.]